MAVLNVIKDRLGALHSEGDEIRRGLVFPIDGKGPSETSIFLHKWVAKVALLIEDLLPREHLIVDMMRKVLNKCKNNDEVFENAMGVLHALEDEVVEGRLQ